MRRQQPSRPRLHLLLLLHPRPLLNPNPVNLNPTKSPFDFMELVKFDRTKAHQRYLLKDGTEVQGATTIIGVMDKPALLTWAYNCGVNGQDFRKVKEDAASVGTLAHFMTECFLKGQTPDLSSFSKDEVDRATVSFNKFVDWWREEEMTVVSSETQLVSERYRYGGTLDITALDRKKRLCLIDIKTSKGIYAKEMGAQVAAYDNLHGEDAMEFQKPHLQRWMIVRIGKKDAGDFQVWPINVSELKLYWNIFSACLDLHKAIKALK